MLLRQRSARKMSDQSLLKPSELPNGNAHPVSQPRKGIRLNRVLGRIVPIILLIYIAYTYDLVVIRYAFRDLHGEQERTLTAILWLLPTHSLFLWSLRAYLRVFFAHDRLPASGATNYSGVISWLRARLGATFSDSDRAQHEDEQHIAQSVLTLLKASSCSDVRVKLCQPDGQPLRCWRDSCNGNLKAFRTRHCGDCGVCRVGFDHHCAWFDNDVTAAATLRPFIGFLISIPPLYLLGLGPLFPTAWRMLRRIQSFTSNDPGIRAAWWSKWYSWIGGPAFRWMVGFALGTSRWSNSTPGRMPHESPRAPVLVAVGAVFVFVATALATSSLTHLRYGKLTVDVERSKAFRKLQRQLEKVDNSQTRVDAIRLKMDSLAPGQHFKVSWTDRVSTQRQERVVSLSVYEGLLSHGSPWANLRRLLSNSTDTTPACSLSDTALRKVLEKASLLIPAP
ncbi:uncharacterized protein SPSC_06297 [Sporisorium scitamineum]|uniref:Palmitoyltransferase n=2 Tax=Sporisorium scitamineum TaxID=49012 RepID=A0A127ZJ31_9BASI|nr:uncharacterized protein SPSC_06297 [Sporisorium scitamineum]